MKKEEKLLIYEQNQRKLIKALTNKIKENKRLKNEYIFINLYLFYCLKFLTEEETKAAKLLAEATFEKEGDEYDPA